MDRRCAVQYFGGYQLYYAMTEPEVRKTTGLDLFEAVIAVFDEVTPAMNLCMQIRIDASDGPSG